MREIFPSKARDATLCSLQPWSSTLTSSRNFNSSLLRVDSGCRANGWDALLDTVENRGWWQEVGDYLTNIWEQLDVCASVTVFTWFAVSRPARRVYNYARYEVLVLVRRVFHCAMTFESYDSLLVSLLKLRITFTPEDTKMLQTSKSVQTLVLCVCDIILYIM